MPLFVIGGVWAPWNSCTAFGSSRRTCRSRWAASGPAVASSVSSFCWSSSTAGPRALSLTVGWIVPPIGAPRPPPAPVLADDPPWTGNPRREIVELEPRVERQLAARGSGGGGLERGASLPWSSRPPDPGDPDIGDAPSALSAAGERRSPLRPVARRALVRQSRAPAEVGARQLVRRSATMYPARSGLYSPGDLDELVRRAPLERVDQLLLVGAEPRIASSAAARSRCRASCGPWLPPRASSRPLRRRGRQQDCGPSRHLLVVELVTEVGVEAALLAIGR